MPRIPALDPQAAPAKVQTLLDGVQRLLGAKPNLFRTLGNSPAVLEGFLSFSGALGRGTLGSQLGEQIALTVAEANGCGYCAAAHTALGKGAGLSDADIEAAREAQASDSRAAAALSFARAVVETRGHVPDAALATARAAGLSDTQVTEIVAHVAANVFTNYFNSVAQTEVDFPAVRAPRVPAAV